MAISLKSKKPDIRYLNDMKKVLFDEAWAKKAPNLKLYYMYRGLKRKNGLRYDITVIPPRLLGREFVKTKGHEHNKNYGELYVVLQGKAIYLVQKYRRKKLQDVYAVKAGKGEAVLIPPQYGHITINPSKTQTLKEANWLHEKCRNAYGLFVEKRGGSYYYTTRGWTKNKRYGKVPRLRFKKPLKQTPKDLSFLYGN